MGTSCNKSLLTVHFQQHNYSNMFFEQHKFPNLPVHFLPQRRVRIFSTLSIATVFTCCLQFYFNFPFYHLTILTVCFLTPFFVLFLDSAVPASRHVGLHARDLLAPAGEEKSQKLFSESAVWFPALLQTSSWFLSTAAKQLFTCLLSLPTKYVHWTADILDILCW